LPARKHGFAAIEVSVDFDYPHFVAGVGRRAGLDPQAAGKVVTITLEAIGRALEPEALDPVTGVLPEPLAEPIQRGAGSKQGVGGFLADVAAHEQRGLGFAKEHAQVVLESLASTVEPRVRALLERRLPAEIAAWLVPHEPPEARPSSSGPRSGKTLATGHPGSEHPLSEARPDLRHANSPAATPDPHADTRLSSTPGDSTDRETLATGRPGSRRPISGV
jgi:uncharacterized protein (DUF2267 family)